MEDAALTGSARCLLLSAGADETVWLYLWDGADSVRSGTVSASVLSREALAETVSQSGYSGVSFAFDDVEADPLYSQLFPLSVLPTELPELPVLSAVSPLSETDWLLSAFGFNVNTRERYVEADGTEVVTEAETDRSLHIRPDGEVTYRAGRNPPCHHRPEELPTEAEAALGASLLLQRLTRDLTGEGALYLQSVQQSGETTQLQYGYHIAGVPVRLSGGPAAEITLSGTSVTRLTLRFRQYTASGESSLLLPLRQTLAIAASSPGQSCLWAMPITAATPSPPTGWRTESPAIPRKGGPASGELPSEKYHHPDPGPGESLPAGSAGHAHHHRPRRPGGGTGPDGGAVRR